VLALAYSHYRRNFQGDSYTTAKDLGWKQFVDICTEGLSWNNVPILAQMVQVDGGNTHVKATTSLTVTFLWWKF
jgi:hypothetical protein